jgi:hypothetical protein
VTSHRAWFREERAVLDQAFAAHPAHGSRERMVRAYRSLFFARVGLAKGDLTFGLMRLADAFLNSPPWTMAIAARRLLRRMRVEGGSEIWDAAGNTR